MLPETLRKELRRIVGRDAVLTDAAQLLAFESDGLTSHRATPAAVVFVHDTEQLLRTVSSLKRAEQPFVPRGAGTGLSGGALADGAVIIELARMNRILWIDADNRRALIQPGVLNIQLNDAVARRGLMYAPDPSSQTACTLGGNVAENSGGPHCLKYGVTANHILGLTIVTADGELIELSGPDAPGYDLVGLFVGSEGTLGICTEIEVRLMPQPAAVETLLAHFDEIDAASLAVSSIIAAGIVPAALEMIDREILKVVEASVFAAGFPTDVAASLIVELDGPAAGLGEEAAEVEKLLAEHGAREIARAESEEDRLRFWRARKAAFGALGRLGSDLLVQDATVPRSRLPKVLRRVLQIGRKYDLIIANVFHAGDGNLHPNIPYDRRDAELSERVHAASREIMQLCVAEGGTITGEHGVGIDKRDYMSLVYSDDDRQAMRWVKEVFDPDGLCNPGKILGPEPPPRAVVDQADQKLIARKGIAATIEAELGSEPLADDPERFVIDGEPAAAAAAPASVDELVAVMRLAAGYGWSVVPAGHGSWLGPGNRLRRWDLVVTTQRMSGDIEHQPDDLLATVPAGVTLEQLGAKLAEANQWWAVEPLGGGSVGATIATGCAGPLAVAFGTPRDSVLGLSVVLADGRLIKPGGRVVKNVAGYDMVKLFTGSWGTLGVIAEAHLRLHALPRADRSHLFSAPRGEQLAAFAAELMKGGMLPPSATEIVSPPAADALGLDSDAWQLVVRWLGGAAAVDAAVQAATDLARAGGGLRSRACEGVWEALQTLEARAPPAVIARTQVPIAGTGDIIGWAGAFAGGEMPALVASPLLGRAWIYISEATYKAAPGDRAWSLRLDDLRAAAVASGGAARLERAPESLRDIAEPWGEDSRSRRFHEGLKDKFDPHRMLKPGFFAGGL